MNPAIHPFYKASVLAIRSAALAAALLVTTSASAVTDIRQASPVTDSKGGGDTPSQSDPDILRHNNPSLTVDLGVGLWGIPLPVDYDGRRRERPAGVVPRPPLQGTLFL